MKGKLTINDRLEVLQAIQDLHNAVRFSQGKPGDWEHIEANFKELRDLVDPDWKARNKASR